MLRPYIATIRHDNGKLRMKVYANSAQEVIRLIQAYEGCPARAIIKIREVK